MKTIKELNIWHYQVIDEQGVVLAEFTQPPYKGENEWVGKSANQLIREAQEFLNSLSAGESQNESTKL